MRFIYIIVTALAFLSSGFPTTDTAQAQMPAGKTQTTQTHAATGPLSDYHGKKRVFVIFAPRADNAAALQQYKSLTRKWREMITRDIIIVQAFSKPFGVLVHDTHGNTSNDAPFTGRALFRQYDAPYNRFAAVLVGKDGQTKAFYKIPVSSETVFDLVDAMPLRQQEIQKLP